MPLDSSEIVPLRVCLSELNAQEIPLSREIEFMDHYLRIQQCRFGDRLRFELSIDSELATCAVPTLVLQPLVENAIRHGIGKHKQSDVVSIRGFVNQGRLSLEIQNQGGKLRGAPERLLTQGGIVEYTGPIGTALWRRAVIADIQRLAEPPHENISDQ